MTFAYISLLTLQITFSVILMLTLHLEIRGVFLDLSKVFDRVWHDGLFYKLKSNGIDGKLFKLFKWFLINGLFSMVNLQSGNQLQLVCQKVQF